MFLLWPVLLKKCAPYSTVAGNKPTRCLHTQEQQGEVSLREELKLLYKSWNW